VTRTTTFLRWLCAALLLALVVAKLLVPNEFVKSPASIMAAVLELAIAIGLLRVDRARQAAIGLGVLGTLLVTWKLIEGPQRSAG